MKAQKLRNPHYYHEKKTQNKIQQVVPSHAQVGESRKVQVRGNESISTIRNVS